MPFFLIKGEFVPEAGRPDGDSIRFRPDDPTPLFMLKRRGHPPRVNERNGTIQLRYEGIDTMESKAALPYSLQATLSNLAKCGVVDGLGTSRGYILSNQVGPNGRPIAFVFAGEPTEDDGTQLFLDPERITQSVNYQQLAEGHAYPLFYDTLYADLRAALLVATQTARNAQAGVWPADVSNTGAVYAGPESLATMPPIFPKLWRRLDQYSRHPDVADPMHLTDFSAYLKSLRDERVLVLPEQKITSFENIIAINGDTVLLRYLPEELVVISV